MVYAIAMRMKRDNLLSLLLSVLAIVISATSLWISLRGQTHARIVDFEDRRGETVLTLEESRGTLDAVIEKLREELREANSPEIKLLIADELHEAQNVRDQLDLTLEAVKARRATAETEARIMVEQNRRESLQVQKDLENLLAQIRSGRHLGSELEDTEESQRHGPAEPRE